MFEPRHFYKTDKRWKCSDQYQKFLKKQDTFIKRPWKVLEFFLSYKSICLVGSVIVSAVGFDRHLLIFLFVCDSHLCKENSFVTRIQGPWKSPTALEMYWKSRPGIFIWLYLTCPSGYGTSTPSLPSPSQSHPEMKYPCLYALLGPFVRRVDNFIQRIKLARSLFWLDNVPILSTW